MTRACWPILLALAGCATAPARPVAGGAEGADFSERVDGDVTETWANGIQILVKRLPYQSLVAAQLYLGGGARNYTAANAGVEALAVASAIGGGTHDLPKSAFFDRLAGIGAQLGGASTEDYSALELKVLRGHWREGMDLLANALLHPALPEAEVELQRQRQLHNLRMESEEPDLALEVRTREAIFRGLPYGVRAIGTPEVVAKLTRADLEAQLELLRHTSRWLLVVTGDVSPQDVARWASAAFGSVPRGDYRKVPFTPPSFERPSLEVVDRKLPTTYVMAAFPGPSWGSPEMPTAVVAMSLLHDQLFEEVRTKLNLSYAPSAGLQTRSLGLGYLYVTAVDPNRTLTVMHRVLTGLETGPIDPTLLEGEKRIFLTHFLMQRETTDGQAALLARAQLFGGDWRLARAFPDKVQQVDAAQVQAFLAHFARNFQTVVLGNPSSPSPIDRSLFLSF
jgi:predicted Zn-dependent peptidase